MSARKVVIIITLVILAIAFTFSTVLAIVKRRNVSKIVHLFLSQVPKPKILVELETKPETFCKQNNFSEVEVVHLLNGERFIIFLTNFSNFY